VKKLRQWVDKAFGRLVGRSILRKANLTWKKVKKLLGQIDEPAQGFPLHLPRLTGRRINFVDEGQLHLG
jgi:hypothetical protein